MAARATAVVSYEVSRFCGLERMGEYEVRKRNDAKPKIIGRGRG